MCALTHRNKDINHRHGPAVLMAVLSVCVCVREPHFSRRQERGYLSTLTPSFVAHTSACQVHVSDVSPPGTETGSLDSVN